MKKLASVSLLILSCFDIIYARRSSEDEYVMQSTQQTQMSALSIKTSTYKKALGLPTEYNLQFATTQQIAAMNHIEIQMKHMFWLIHPYDSLKLEDIKAAWNDFQDKIVGYGCHCFIGAYTVGGQGKAQDNIDLACKEYNHCIRCIDLDRIEENYFVDRPDKTCTAHSPYYSKLKREYNSHKKAISCGRGAEQNGKQSRCQLANCYCDRAFAMAVASWWSHYNEDNHGMYNKGMEPCVYAEASLGPPTGCCGPYPGRRSYWQENGRDCCGNDIKIQQIFRTSQDLYCCDPEAGTVCESNIQ